MLEGGDVDRPVEVGGDGLEHAGTEAEHPQRSVDGGVALLTADDAYRRRTDQTVALDVPADLGEDVMSRRGEADGVGLLRAGDEADGRAGRESEQLLQPRAGGVLGGQRRRRHRSGEGVLVPPGGDDLGRRGSVEGTADDEAEVARPDAADEAGVGSGNERVEHG